MKICVLGAGVVGLTTAYYLAQAGHVVTVIDRNGLPGQETSYANGGQLSYSYLAPLASAAIWRSLPRYIAGDDAALRLYWGADIRQWRWLFAFLRACNRTTSRRHTADLASLARLSRAMMHRLVAEEELDFEFSQRGKLVIYRDLASLASARKLVVDQAEFGAEQHILDAEGCIALEPALAGLRGDLAGGVFTASDEAGDCQKFCLSLGRVLQDRYGVDVRYHHRIGALKRDRQRIRSVVTDRGEFESDAFIVAAGLFSRDLVRPLGIEMSLCALKGYSLTVPLTPAAVAPAISVTDSRHRIVYARLGDALRIAAMVDIGAPHAGVDESRLKTLKRQVSETFPHLCQLDRASSWAGQRAATPHGKPIVGSSGYENLWLNAGHGALGFTLACGTGKLICEMVSGQKASVSPQPWRL